MQVAGYIRVSTEKQSDNGVSLDAQRAQIAAYAGLYGYELVEIVADEGQSGKTTERPGLQRVLALLDDGQVQGVIVAKLDRLTRSVRDLGVLLETYFSNGFVLASVAEQIDTKTANGRMVLNILMSVAQWEREAISERTKQALAHKRARGERVSGEAPYGKRFVEGRIEDNPDEQRVIRLVMKWRQEGKTFRKIVDLLKGRGVRGRTGNPLSVAQVHGIAKAVGAHPPA